MRRTGWAAGALVVAVLLPACSDDPEGERSAGASATAPSSTAGTPESSVPTTPGSAPAVPTSVPTVPTAGPGGQAAPAATVPARPVRSLPPVPLEGRDGAARPAEVGALRVDVVAAVPVVSAGVGPGEVQGEDAVAFTVRWSNGGDRPVPLDTVVVDLSYGDRVPASPVGGPPGRPAPPSVAPGSAVTGTYVFALPRTERASVVLTVRQGADLPTAVFTGPAL